MSYADNQTIGTSSVGSVEKETRQIKQNEGNMMQVNVRKLVTFIAGVINGTADVKSKTERIQLIVMAAERHLDITWLSWETVRDDLKHQYCIVRKHGLVDINHGVINTMECPKLGSKWTRT